MVLEFAAPDQKIAFLKSLFEETYISDIVGRHNIRNKAELEELLNILFSAIGSLTNPEKLSAIFQTVKKKKIRNSTIKRNGKNNKFCPNCWRKMKQQFTGLRHCKSGMGWKRDIGFFERTPDMVFRLRSNALGRPWICCRVWRRS